MVGYLTLGIIPKRTGCTDQWLLCVANCKPIFDCATIDRWLIMKITGSMTLEDCTKEVIDEWKKFRDVKREEYDYREALKLFNLKRRYEKACALDPTVAEYHASAKKRREDKEVASFEFRCQQTQHFERTASTSTLEGQAARYAAMSAPHLVQKQKDALAPLAGSSTDVAVARLQDTKLVFL